MLNALRSEWIKQSTLRSTAVYLVLLVGSLFGPVVLMGLLNSDSFGDEPQTWDLLLQGVFIFVAIAVSFAASRTTSDIKNHMTAQAFLTQQGRWQSLAAKLVVLTGIVVTAYILGVALIVASVKVFGGSVDTENISQIFAALALGVTASAVGVGLGAFLRSSIAAVALPLVWLFVGETLIQAASGSHKIFEPVAKILLTENYSKLGSAESIGMALAVFAGWIVVFGAAGFVSNQLRDVK